MLELAEVGPADIVCDPGCGDGRLLIEAWDRWKARGIGVEIDPARAAIAIDACRGKPITVVCADSRKLKLGQATVFVCHLTYELLGELAPKMATARLVVSYGHEVPGLDCERVERDGHVFYVATPNAAQAKPSRPKWRLKQ